MSAKKILAASLAAFSILVASACGLRAAYDAGAFAPGDSGVEARAEPAPERKDSPLSEEQEEGLSSYSPEAKEVSDILRSCPWSAESGAGALFGEGTVTESGSPASFDDGEASPFVIGAVERRSESDGKGGSVLVWTGSVQTAKGDSIFRLSQARPASGAQPPWQLECSALARAKSYSQALPAAELAVSGLPEEISSLIGGNEGEARMQSRLRDWCSSHVPGAQSAKWDRKALIDWGQKTVVLSFDLSAGRKAKVMCEIGGAGFEIGRG